MLISLALLAVVLVAAILIYNGLVRLNVRAANAWADIDVQLKRRHDLVPSLVEAVKGYAAHERGTLDAVVEARGRAMQATGPAAAGEAEASLTGALRHLFALVESYPQLRAAENFADLQRSLSELEDAIQNARRYYNAVVRDLNTKIQQVPSNIVAMLGGFRPREFFQLSAPEEAAVPGVTFDRS